MTRSFLIVIVYDKFNNDLVICHHSYICSQIITVYIDIATNNKILYRSDHKWSQIFTVNRTWSYTSQNMMSICYNHAKTLWHMKTYSKILNFYITRWIQQFRSTINLIWGILQFNLSRNTICKQNERRMTLELLHNEI